jgi:hypothetical protein
MTGLSEIRETDGSVYLRITAIDGGVQAGRFSKRRSGFEWLGRHR